MQAKTFARKALAVLIAIAALIVVIPVACVVAVVFAIRFYVWAVRTGLTEEQEEEMRDFSL